jgi:acylphosphatase
MHFTWTSLGGYPHLISETINPGQRLLTLAAAPDGRLEAFALGTDGGVFHLWQTAPGVWSPPEHWTARGAPAGITFGGPDPELRIGPVVATNADGRLEILALGDDGGVWQLWQTEPGGFWLGSHQWTPRGRPAGIALRDLVVAPHADARLAIFALGHDGGVWQIAQGAPNAGWMPEWTTLGHPAGIALGTLAAMPRADGRIELFAAASDGAIWSTLQAAPNAAWPAPSPWRSRGRPGAATLSRPALRRGARGEIEAFAIGSDGGLWQARGPAAPGARGPVEPWVSRGGPGRILGLPALAANTDGRLEVVVLGAEGSIHHAFQRSAAGWLGAASWNEIARGAAAQPALARNADGRLELLVVDEASGEVLRALQGAAGSWG